MIALRQLRKHFPNAKELDDVVHRHATALSTLGFRDENTLACVGACRDEMTQSLFDQVHRHWGEAFSFSSLGGMLLLGKTGFAAAVQHAPVTGGRARCVFYATVHLGINDEGVPGKLSRPGREHTAACGALVGLHDALAEGRVDMDDDDDDLERVVLARRVCSQLTEDTLPTLLELTDVALNVVARDLSHLVDTLDRDTCDYAIITATHIHARHREFLDVRDCFAVCDGVRVPVAL